MAEKFGKRRATSRSARLSALPERDLPGDRDEDSIVTTLTAKFTLAILSVFVVQTIPGLGPVLMFLFAPFWIGLLAHAYVGKITVLALTGEITGVFLVLPVIFYGAGIAAGAYSDIMTSRWMKTQTWLSTSGTVPSSIDLLTFDAWNMIEGDKLPDPYGVFRPETAGFKLATINSTERPRMFGDSRFILNVVAGSLSCRRTSKSQVLKIGDRCFRREEMAKPSAFVLINRKSNDTEQATTHPWGVVWTETFPIIASQNGEQRQVGTLRGMIVKKLSYFLFPTAGCWYALGQSGRACFWSVLFREQRNGYGGFMPTAIGSSDESAPLLMQALLKIRGS